MKNKIRNSAVLAGVLIISMLSGCCGQTALDTASDTQTEPAAVQMTEPATHEITIKSPFGVTMLSLYRYNQNAGIRERSEGYSAVWEQGKDIVSFEAFATDVSSFTLAGSNFKKEWERYWNAYENHEQCKIGYTVSFRVKDGGEINQTILGPEDVFGYRNYLECYLYDDVHQVQGNWYSHLLSSEVNENTVMTSIKLTAGQDIAQVEDTITLTAFVYSSETDFDADGSYSGGTSYKVTIKNAL